MFSSRALLGKVREHPGSMHVASPLLECAQRGACIAGTVGKSVDSGLAEVPLEHTTTGLLDLRVTGGSASVLGSAGGRYTALTGGNTGLR